jgi:hypothetical protein
LESHQRQLVDLSVQPALPKSLLVTVFVSSAKLCGPLRALR